MLLETIPDIFILMVSSAVLYVDTELTEKDELLNPIWYAGAYTKQLCTIDPNHGYAVIHIFQINSPISDATNVAWYNNYTVTNGSSALTDGAKRDILLGLDVSYKFRIRSDLEYN
jgi:hypothetical protein